MKAKNIESGRNNVGKSSSDFELPKNDQPDQRNQLETITPKREDESHDEYKFRTMLHEDEESSVARVALVARRIEAGAGVSLSDLTPRELISLSNYYLWDSRRNHAAVIDFAKKYGTEGLKALMVSEYGMEAGDKVIEMGKNSPPETAIQIFKKYDEIIEMTNGVADEISRQLGPVNKLNQKQIKAIKENIISRGKSLIDEFNNISRHNGASTDLEKLIERLDDVKSDIILFGSTFKALSESGDKVELNDFSSARMETKKPADLSPTEKEEMVRMFLDNRESGYPQKLLRSVFDDFEQSINPEEGTPKAQSDFIVLKYNNSIVSFMRLEPRGPGHIYAAAFNTRPEAKGFKIGNAMMQEVIDNVSKKNVVEAIAYGAKPDLIEFYKSKFGFQEVGETEIAGEKFIKLERNDGVDQAGKVPEAA